MESGRGERIRTSGLCVPNAALYQAEPHPVPSFIKTKNGELFKHARLLLAVALLLTNVRRPLVIAMLAVAILIQVFFNSGLAY
jgi:hypothetical protein